MRLLGLGDVYGHKNKSNKNPKPSQTAATAPLARQARVQRQPWLLGRELGQTLEIGVQDPAWKPRILLFLACCEGT